MASASQESQKHGRACVPSKVKITILASEWGSNKGGLSTINRELAIQLAKSSSVEITFFSPKCSEEEKKAALNHHVNILEAKRRPGYEELEWLSFPPEHLQVDVIVGHGVILGRQAQIIRESHKCKWVQVVHTDPEELGMFKCYPNSISKGEKKHNVEIELCEISDFIVGVGPKLSEAFRRYLRWCEKDQTVFDFTPGVFDEFLNIKQVPEERKHRSVLAFGRGDAEDFELKGFDIAARAVALLPDTHLVFFGAPDGNHEEIAQRLLSCGVPASRLRVRSYDKSRESLKRLFCEVDLVVMPSRTEGFGLTGLEALSAGLPVLITKNSGFGEALSKVPFGSFFVIDSEDPERWAAAIKGVWEKDRQNRLEEANTLRAFYERKYSWGKQCDALLFKMMNLVRAHLRVQIDCEAITGPGKHGIASGLAVGSIPSAQEVLNFIATKYFKEDDPSKPEQLNGFLRYLEKVHNVLFVVDVKQGSLIFTVEIGSLQILEELWKDYHTGHLNEVAQKFLVTEEVLTEFGLTEVRLATAVADEEYIACQEYFFKSAAAQTSSCLKIVHQTKASQSIADGEGLTEAVAGSEAQFILTTKGTEGRQCYNERDQVTVEVQEEPTRALKTEVRITDHNNGQHQISYCPKDQGIYSVIIKVNGKHIHGSPFNLLVKAREQAVSSGNLSARGENSEEQSPSSSASRYFSPEQGAWSQVGSVKPFQFKPISCFGKKGSSVGMFDYPWGVAVSDKDEIAVTDCSKNHRVQLFNSSGVFLRCFGRMGANQGEFRYPCGICFDNNGNIYVADSDNKKIQIFSCEGRYIGKIGEKGTNDHQLSDPRGLSLDANGNIIVADAGDKLIKIFTTDGQFVRKIGGPGCFSFPVHCVQCDEYFMVSDRGEHCIKVFSGEGKFQFQFGQKGEGDGELSSPRCLLVTKSKQLMVCDWDNHRLQVFELNGRFVGKFGTKGDKLGQFGHPTSVAVLSNGRMVVCEFGNHRIQIFE